RALTNFSLETLKQDKFSVDVTKMKTISGKGVIGTVNNEEWFVGKEYMTENNSNPFYGTKATELANEGKTVVFVSHNDKIVSIYELIDIIRNDAVEAIKTLNKRVVKTEMITADNELTAQSIAKETRIQTYVSECIPDEKLAVIKVLMQ